MLNYCQKSAFECLENRQLLSASLTDSGHLVVLGDPSAPNTITVGLSSDGTSVDVVVNGGAVQAFAATAVQSVYIVGGAGDDVLKIDETNGKFTIPTKIFGEGGDDYIQGGSGNQYLSGGDGSDTIIAGSGSATLLGGNGADSIVGGAGTDLISGGNGRDKISAGSGATNVDGGAGADTIVAGSGSDVIGGGGGANVLSGGAGHDTLIGGGGSNHFKGGSGGTAIFSKSGNDVINVGAGNTTLSGNTGGDKIHHRGDGSVQDGDMTPPTMPTAPDKSAPTDTPVVTTVGTVSGTLTGPDGTAAVGATVLLYTTEDENGGFKCAAKFSTTTDANGNYTLDNIPAGDFVVVAGEENVGFAHTTVTVSDGATTSLDIALEAFANPHDGGTGSISGMVSDGNANPVAGVTVTLTAEDAGDSTATLTTTTGADGSYALSGILAGKYDVVVVEAGAGYADVTAIIVKNENTMVDVTVTTVAPPVVDGGTVSGTVVDGEGHSVSAGTVGLTDTTSGRVFFGSIMADGTFSLSVPAGTYNLVAGKHGVGLTSVSGVVVSGGATTTEDLTLTEPNPAPPAPPSPSPEPTPNPSEAGTISGMVTDSQGNAVADCTVATSVSGQEYVTHTDDAGDYSLSVPAGTVRLSAGKDGVGTVSENGVVVTAGETTAEDLQLAAPPGPPAPNPDPTPTPVADGTVSGMVVDGSGNAVSSATVALLAGKQEYFAGTDGNGDFTISAPPGTYELVAGRQGLAEGVLQGVVVVAGEGTTDNLTLEPFAKGSGGD